MSGMKPKLLVEDGASMLAIAYYAYMPNEMKSAKSDVGREKYYSKLLHAPDGTYTNAVFGMCVQMSRLLSGWKQDYLAVVFQQDQEHVPQRDVRRRTAHKKRGAAIAFRDMLARIRHMLGGLREETTRSNIRMRQLYEEFGFFGAGDMSCVEEEPMFLEEGPINPTASPAALAMQELVADIRVELLVQLPDDTLTWEAALAIISAAFRNADIGGWMDSAEVWVNDDIAWIDLTVRTTGLGAIEAAASCTRKLEYAGTEMLKSGYRIMDLACTAAEA